MTEQVSPSYTTGAPPTKQPSGVAVGFTLFAGCMMILAGVFQMIYGISALAKDNVALFTQNYVFKFDTTTWGWIHLLVGLGVLLAGFGVIAGNIIGRIVGVALAVLSAVVNFAAIPHYPFWSMTIIAIDVFVIWALTAHGKDIRSDAW